MEYARRLVTFGIESSPVCFAKKGHCPKFEVRFTIAEIICEKGVVV